MWKYLALLLTGCLVANPASTSAFSLSERPVTARSAALNHFESQALETPLTTTHAIQSKPILIGMLVLAMLAGPSRAQAPAQTSITPPVKTPAKLSYLSAWLANNDPNNVDYALAHYAERLQELNLPAVTADAQGNLVVDSDFLRHVQVARNVWGHKPQLMLTVANQQKGQPFDHAIIKKWIGSSDRRHQTALALVFLAQNYEVDGIDLDLETLSPADGPALTAFLEEAGRLLHAVRKTLNVTLEARFLKDSTVNWKQISQSVDQLRFMAYLYHYRYSSPGAVSPPKEVFHLTELALSRHIPLEKLGIALTNLGFDWIVGSHKSKAPADTIDTPEKLELVKAMPDALVVRDRETSSLKIIYFSQDGRQLHEAWIEDTSSIVNKTTLLQKLGAKTTIWQLAVGEGLAPLLDATPVPPPPVAKVTKAYITADEMWDQNPVIRQRQFDREDQTFQRPGERYQRRLEMNPLAQVGGGASDQIRETAELAIRMAQAIHDPHDRTVRFFENGPRVLQTLVETAWHELYVGQPFPPEFKLDSSDTTSAIADTVMERIVTDIRAAVLLDHWDSIEVVHRDDRQQLTGFVEKLLPRKEETEKDATEIEILELMAGTHSFVRRTLEGRHLFVIQVSDFVRQPNLSFLSGQLFDAVVCSLAGMDFMQPKAVLQSVQRHLKPGGKIIFVYEDTKGRSEVLRSCVSAISGLRFNTNFRIKSPIGPYGVWSAMRLDDAAPGAEMQSRLHESA